MFNTSKKTEIHYWGHASYSFLKDKVHLIIDPVLTEPFEYGNTFFNPPREINIDKAPPVNVIYISHAHGDNLDIPSLRYLCKNPIKIFCPEDPVVIECLKLLGCKIHPLKPEEKVAFGPYTLFTTPSMTSIKELGVIVKTEDMTVWNQVDTSVSFETIWNIKNKFIGKIDILFCPFQPLKEYCISWPEETSFPTNRFENLLTKALSVEAKYILPSSCSLKIGNYWKFVNTRMFPTSKFEFIKELYKRSPEVKAYEVEAGDKLTLNRNKLIIEKSFFIKRTGEKIDFNTKDHPDIEELNSEPLSDAERDKVVLRVKKLPVFLSKIMSSHFNYYLEYMKARNCSVVLELISGNKNLIFVMDNCLKRIRQTYPKNNWDYWFQYSALDLFTKITNPFLKLKFYAYRNSSFYHKINLATPMALYGINEDHSVDDYINDHPLNHWPF